MDRFLFFYRISQKDPDTGGGCPEGRLAGLRELIVLSSAPFPGCSHGTAAKLSALGWKPHQVAMRGCVFGRRPEIPFSPREYL